MMLNFVNAKQNERNKRLLISLISKKLKEQHKFRIIIIIFLISPELNEIINFEIDEIVINSLNFILYVLRHFVK